MASKNKKTKSPDSFTQYLTALQEMSNNNTARTFAFNSDEAQKSRDWQEYMSGTSHQREVDDLIAAGLNPVLSANGGAQAYSASNASGSADSSAISAMSNLIANKMSNDASLKIAKISANVGYASAAAQKAAAAMSAGATMAAAASSAASQRYAADKNYESQKYVIDNQKVNSIEGLVDKYIGPYVNGSGKKTVWEESSAYNNPKGQTTMGGGRK